MKLFGSFVVCFLVNILIAGPITTGKSLVESGKVISRKTSVTEEEFLLEREMLQNPGFETGSLYPWTTNNWIVDTIYPRQGRYCASVVGNYWIRQDIHPIFTAFLSHITFWARQPEAPAAQAYDFIYSDSTIEEFVHYPTADWAQYDVTANLNQQKVLVAFQLWGYSGGGPNPDSTYIDDVSITRIVDVGIAAVISPVGDTFQLNDTIRPMIIVQNYGQFPESIWVWCRIEHTCSTHIYRDSSLKILQIGMSDTVGFNIWTPRYTGQHRFRFELSPNDTTPWFYFWVVEGIAIKENNDSLISNKVIVRPTIGKSFEFLWTCENKVPKVLKIYNATGKLVWTKKFSTEEIISIQWYGKDQLGRDVSPGVYIARIGYVTKRIILSK